MTNRKWNTTKSIWILIPVAGIFLFIFLYIVAAFLYPGGSQFDKSVKGFSWLNNYWCNLLNRYAINGEYNPARPVAISATIILCLSLAVFWYHLPLLFIMGRYGRSIIQFSGIISMAITIFLFTDYHNEVINVAGVFGVIALIGTFIGLYKSRLYPLFGLGIFCLILVIINNYIYYTNNLISYLPLIQKITFLIFLFWILWMNINLYRKIQTGY